MIAFAIAELIFKFKSFALECLAGQPGRTCNGSGEACFAARGVVCQSCGDACPEGAIRFRPRLGGPALPTLDAGRLLPAFPGLHTHQRAIEAGCKVAGLTVHQVTVELDHGPILAQAVVPVLPDDTAASLAERVLVHEHRVYPQAIAAWLGETK